MLKKIIILLFIFVFLSSSCILASDISLENIQKLIAENNNKQALEILTENNLNNNPDLLYYKALLLSWEKEYVESEKILLQLIDDYPERLEFYNHLARIYGWQRKFEKAKKIIARAQQREYSSTRMALLARHAEWQGNWFEAQKLIKIALTKAESNELKNEYQSRLKIINQKIRTELFIKGKFIYSPAARDDISLRLGLEKPLNDGINSEISAGVNHFKDEFNLLLGAEIELAPPLLFNKTNFSSTFNFYQGDSKDKIELNNSLNYFFNSKNRAGISFEIVKDDASYQNLELEYEYRFKKIIMVLKNSSRHYSTGWISDFSQHLDFYYPRDNYLLNFRISHYQDGENLFRVGFEFSNLFSEHKYSFENLNLWFNNQQTGNLDFRLNLR
ncbi:lipopolysaccharide assembly protein LapB [Halanaerobium sp. ST460_2HS_T2]|uniref:tetratricopeptide repeat protein n=1 Tax=Halanaerobium sp. ST460_2HS_T2 TaxID=2183914 RepID=UPI000DF1C73C|nr:tetratricopeptide repeat protein [Halanaerobium sp. ST460_2HS_T2]RCW52995.1 hypothetical protein DFR80_12427 [Halanaerobium sp. ST460_2HS_T2]